MKNLRLCMFWWILGAKQSLSPTPMFLETKSPENMNPPDRGAYSTPITRCSRRGGGEPKDVTAPTPQPGVTVRSRTRAQAHTPTPYTPARSGRVEAERAHKHTHSPIPQPGVAGRSRNPGPSTTQTQTQAPHNSKKRSVHSPGSEAASAMQLTRPNEIPRSGVRPHPNACAALGLGEERATPERL